MLANRVTLQVLLDVLCKHLAQLNTPLVEAVNAPDCTLGKRQVLVVCDQCTQSGWRDFLREDRSCWTIAKEGLVWYKFIWSTFGFYLIWGLAHHESFGLSKEVGCQHALMLSTFDRVVGLSCHNEIGRDELGPLVKELEERVLGVGSWLTEENGAGCIFDVVTSGCDGLAVRLHGQLLEICGEAVEVLIEWRNKVSLGSKEVRVPDRQKTADDWDVLLQWSLQEVLIHGVCTGQELVKVIITNEESNAQANRRPDGVTATDPVLEAKHVLAVDSKFGNFSFVGRKSNKVFCNILILCGLQEPCFCCVGICRSLSGGEGLGSDEEQCCLRIGVFQSFCDMCTVDVADEVELEAWLAICFQCFCDHDWTTTTC